jgi:outer membrane lipoprotein-sorting protein
MKKSMMLTAMLAMAVLFTAQAQDLDKILDHHFKAVGQKNLQKIKTLKATGTASMMGMDVPFSMQAKRPGMVRTEVEVQGAKIVQVYDGENAWAVNPLTGSSMAVDLTGTEAEGLKENADLDGQLWNYKEKGHTLSLDGSGEVNGKDCYVLKLDKKNGQTDYYYIDKEDYLIRELRTSRPMNGTPMEVEALMSDYRDVDGYKMPFNTEQRAGGQTFMTLKMDQVETNVDLDDSLFDKPSGN